MALIMRVRVALNGWQGGPGLLTYYFRPNQTTLAGDAAIATARVRGALTVLAPILATVTNAQVSGVCDVLEDTNGELVSSAAVAAPALVAGTAVGAVGPPQVMMGLLLDTGSVVDKRKLRARSFIGPLGAAFTNTVVPSVSASNVVAAYGVALVTTTPPAAATPLVAWHRPRKATTALPFRAGNSIPVVSSSPAGKFFTLRSRLN